MAAGTTTTSATSPAKRGRPTSSSVWWPKIQKNTMLISTQMLGALAIGQVTRRHSWPLRTSAGMNANASTAALLSAHRNIDATDSRQSSAVVVTSMLPMRNQPSRRRGSGNESWKRPVTSGTLPPGVSRGA